MTVFCVYDTKNNICVSLRWTMQNIVMFQISFVFLTVAIFSADLHT